MNYEKTNPKGVDKAINKIKKRLYSDISTIGDIEAFGRVYPNYKGKRVALESFIGGDEYLDVLSNDDSRFFFYVNNEDKFNDDPSSLVDVFFMVDLDDFYSSNERMDEEFRMLAITSIRNTSFKVTSVTRDDSRLLNILKGYSSTNLKFDNMHPKLIFSVQGNINYNSKTCI